MMKLKTLSMLALAGFFALSSCEKDDSPNNPPNPTESEVLTGSIIEDKILQADVVYTLKGSVIVEDGAKLTIPAGTMLEADQSDGLDALIIDQGGKIDAVGTASKPIVFTEVSQTIGSWGGIVILGKAPINVPGGTSSPEFNDALTYGGNKPNDNSGVLSFVRVEYAGAGIIEGSVEYNGFGFYAVGSGTSISNLQTYKGSDDGYEFFGGTVVANNLLSVGDEDDSFDWTEGWTGGGSNWIAIKTGVGDKGMEGDNNENDNTLQPMSNPTISNVTLIGMGIEDGMRLRRGTAGTFDNVLITGFSDGIDIRDDQTILNAVNGTLKLTNIRFGNVENTVVAQNSQGQVVEVPEGTVQINQSADGANAAFTQGWTVGYNDYAEGFDL